MSDGKHGSGEAVSILRVPARDSVLAQWGPEKADGVVLERRMRGPAGGDGAHKEAGIGKLELS